MSSPPNLPNLPTEVLRAILKEAFAGSEIRISLCHKNDPALINESVLEYFGTFVQLVDPESLALTPLVNFKRRPQASSHGNVFVASAVNNYFGPLIACRQLYQESFPIFWQSTKFVLEEGITSDDLVAWIPALWNSHIARVQTEGISHVLAKELKGTRGFERLEQLRICDYGDAQPPPVIHEISDQTDQKADEMILLCRVSCWRDMSFPMRTMAKLAALVPSLNIVISFPVAVYYSNDAVATWMDSSKTFAGWLPDVDVEIHTKPPMIFLDGVPLREYKKTYVRPDDATILHNSHLTNESRYQRGMNNHGLMPLAVMCHILA